MTWRRGSHESDALSLSLGTIRLWDVRSGQCLQTVFDHHADVYGLHCHPLRPFLFVSSSRDTTLRMWSAERLVAPAALKVAIPCFFDAPLASWLTRSSCMLRLYAKADSMRRPLASRRPSSSPGRRPLLRSRCAPRARSSTKRDLTAFGPHVPPPPLSLSLSHRPQLCGHGSRALAALPAGSSHKAVCSFFYALPGVRDLWALVDAVAQGKPSPANALIPHINDLRDIARSRAKLLEMQRGIGRKARAEKLRVAAQLHMKMVS